MKKRVLLATWFLPLLLLTTTASPAEDSGKLGTEEPMTNVKLEQTLKTLEPGTNGGNGRWQMLRDGVPVLIWGDESQNRMLAMAPVAELKRIDLRILMRMMEANLATALDARYAVFEGIVWSVFVHPLDSLRERDLISGLQQVVALVKTAGTTYSSSELRLGFFNEENSPVY